MGELVRKDVKYLNKDFAQFRANLIDFTKNYFPNTYNDFNETSPGMLMIELAAYVGDVLSFYGDSQLKESLMATAEERKNVLTLAEERGYKPKNVVPAAVDIDVFQLLPVLGSGNDVRPDWNYALSIKDGMVIGSKTNRDIEFRTVESVDFGFSSSFSPTTVTIHSIDSGTGEPTNYLIKKTVQAVSGKINSTDFVFTSPKIYDKITLEVEGIIEVVDILDSDGGTWYEVPYMAQDTIFQQIENIAKNDPDLNQYRDSVPYLLKLLKTSKRFITRNRDDNFLDIQFGAGISDNADEEIIPNPDNIGNALPGGTRTLDVSIDPSNFLYTKTYGLAPANTTLTVRYTTGGGVDANVPSFDLENVLEVKFNEPDGGLDQTTLNQMKASVAATNPIPASGGKSKDTIDEIRNNALAFFGAQNRVVTKDDYIVRAYSMPARFGSIAKGYIVKDDFLDNNISKETVPNPLAMNLYVLGYDSENKLVSLNPAIKENLMNYIGFYRMYTDAVNIKNAFVINIGLNFEIITRSDVNANETLLRCIERMKSYFDIRKWQINQPIPLDNIKTELDKIEGVQTVVNVEVVNKYDMNAGYSGNVYNIAAATKNNIVYPSLDPSIFEIKYPNIDIQGKVNTF